MGNPVADTVTEPETDDTTAEVDQPDEGQSPEDLRAELARIRAALTKANKEAATHRKAAEAAARKGETDAEAKVREAVEKATGDATTTWKRRVVNQAIKAALADAGYTGSVDFARRLIDSDAADVDEDGEVTGLDDQIRALKKEMPEKFTKRGGRQVDAADRGGTNGGSKSAEQRTSERLLNQWTAA